MYWSSDGVARWLLPLVLFASAPIAVTAGEGEPSAEAPARDVTAVDFARDVRPILERRCLECHSADKSKGGLVLESRELALRTTDSGEVAIMPGDAAASELLRRVVSKEDYEWMPPEGERLAESEIETLRKWIDAGLDWPNDDGERRKHWAYVAPKRSPPPMVSAVDWPRNAIDHFVLARLEAEGLSPSPAADRAKLLRRVSLDLTGLPPTLDELNAYLADTSDEAYEKAVDRLLASPRYGERWARPWLDMARYADSNGFQRDGVRTMWAYRDWVIDAFNRDMPFDQFTIWQLAGDLLPGATAEQRIATGFNRCATINLEAGTDVEETRVNQVIDRVNTTASVWLGSTIECAQCHNHKYDPFTQVDYYRLLAYFNNTAGEVSERGTCREFAGPEMPLALSEEEQARRSRLEARYRDMEKSLAEQMASADERALAEWEARMRKAVAEQPVWRTLPVAVFQSTGGARPRVLKDGSVLVEGETPDKDTYTVEVETDLTGIRALRIEALTHATLPGRGPGRGNTKQPNFVLSELSVTAAPLDGDSAPVKLALESPRSSFDQTNFEAARAIDGNALTGWAIAPKFGQPHQATFLLREPIGGGGTRLVFRLRQTYGGGRTIGRLRLSATADSVDVEALDLDAGIAAIFAKSEDSLTEKERLALREYYLSSDDAIQRMRSGMDSLKKRLDQIAPPTTMVMRELDEPRMTSLFKRGDFLNLGAAVTAGTPASLHALDENSDDTRLGLARWLVSRENPLVARVTVNRWWQEFFGRGLVATPEDFGTQGDRATHPELLDWLAVEFMDSGWSMKHIHKRIVMSATYRQDSRVDAKLLARDPNNTLLARGPRVRLDAETIRDNALAISGLLSDKMGGPPVFPPQPDGLWRVTGLVDNTYRTSTDEDRYRRGIYVIWRRSAPYPSFVNFDAPDRSRCVISRSRTNTPLQALTLLNDPAYVEMALALATRMAETEGGQTLADDRTRLEVAFRACVARRPTAEETQVLVDVLTSERARLSNNEPAAAEIVGDWPVPAGVDTAEVAAWFFVANMLLNLDETITKG